MSSDSIISNVSIQLENWLEKHSRSCPRRWLKRYFRFNGEYLSYSKNDSTKSSEKFKISISDISDVKMIVNSEGKNVLYIIINQSKDGENSNSNSNELEISMPNQQILKIWYNSIKECIDNNSKLKTLKSLSGRSLNKPNSSHNNNNDIIRSTEEIPVNRNKPLPQPNVYKKNSNKDLNMTDRSLPNIVKENINKRPQQEKSSALSKLDALLGDLKHTISLSELERKSMLILNNYERIGLSPLSNTMESSPLKQNYNIDSINMQNNEKVNSLMSNNNKNNIKELQYENDKELKISTLPPEEKTNRSNEEINVNSKFNYSDPTISLSKKYENRFEDDIPNRKNTLVDDRGSLSRENDELISDINKKINFNMYNERDGRSNSYVYNMAVNNYNESEYGSRNNSITYDSFNININTKSSHSSNVICTPVINKPKQREIYAQFQSSLNLSLDLVNILIQILFISTDSVDIYFTEYKEVILTKSSDLINKSSSLFKQINDETRQNTNISISETVFLTKNQKMIELANNLASIIRKVVSSLKMYLKIVKKDQLIQTSEFDIKSMVNSEIESNKKLTIKELKQSMNNLKNNLTLIQNEFEKIEI
ncbi:hypothetical protein U3516DRAFT_603053, partial [Neocallimastix sp. 'constans']